MQPYPDAWVHVLGAGGPMPQPSGFQLAECDMQAILGSEDGRLPLAEPQIACSSVLAGQVVSPSKATEPHPQRGNFDGTISVEGCRSKGRLNGG